MSRKAPKTPLTDALEATPSPSAALLDSFQIDWWDIDRPIPYARNPRKITPEAIDKVAASIKEYGWQQAIVVDADGVVVCGHTRLLAARKLEAQQVPVKVAAGLTPQQIKGLRLADNRTGTEAKNDYELLALELAELKDEFDFDLSLTGFDSHEIEPLLAAEWSPKEDAGEFDDAKPEKEGKPEMRSIDLTVEQHEVVGRAILAIRSDEGDPTMSDGRALELISANFLAGSRYEVELPEGEEVAE